MDLWQTLSWIPFRENCNEWSVFEFISMVSSNLIQLNYEWMLLFVNGDNNFKSGKFFLIWLGRFQVNIWSLTILNQWWSVRFLTLVQIVMSNAVIIFAYIRGMKLSLSDHPSFGMCKWYPLVARASSIVVSVKKRRSTRWSWR